MDNPCTILPVSENWITDFTNLRCYRNYQVDSGWLYNNNFLIQNSNSGQEFWIFNNIVVCSTLASSCTNGNSTYYKGNVTFTDSSYDYWTLYNWQIKKVDNLTEYKSFSSF